MNGRGIVGILFGVIVVALIIGAGAGVYNAGLAQGLAQAGAAPAGTVVPYAGYAYGYGFHPFFGFGFIGLLFPILFLFLIFGLVRAAFRGGRGGWGGGWGHRGWGPGGPGGYDGWREQREQQIADFHRRLHESEGAGQPGGSAGSGGTGGSSGSSSTDGPGSSTGSGPA